jgi:hypothetical protein
MIAFDICLGAYATYELSAAPPASPFAFAVPFVRSQIRNRAMGCVSSSSPAIPAVIEAKHVRAHSPRRTPAPPPLLRALSSCAAVLVCAVLCYQLVGMYSAETLTGHTLYVDLQADGTARWRHDIVDGRKRGSSGACNNGAKWLYREKTNDVHFTELTYDGKSFFTKNIPALTLLGKPFLEVQAEQSRKAAAAGAPPGKRVSVVGQGNAKDNMAAALKAPYKRISNWPADFGTANAETSPQQCVGCSTSFKS